MRDLDMFIDSDYKNEIYQKVIEKYRYYEMLEQEEEGGEEE